MRYETEARARSVWGKRLIQTAMLLAALAVAAMIATAARANVAQDIDEARAALRNGNPLKALSEAFRDIARGVEPSVVHVEVQAKRPRMTMMREMPGFELPPGFEVPRNLPEPFRRFFEMPRSPAPDERQEETERYEVPQAVGNGSGWVYDTVGHIITNNHVVESADRLVVKFADGSEAEAEVVGTDPNTDIAVIKVDPSRVRLYPAEVSTAPVEQGDIVFAFGSPLRFEFSMSQGIVSGKGRQMGILGREGYENFIQTDAAINPGNSGGPLVDIEGRVVGMNTAIASRSGLFSGVGFAIPAPMIHSVVDQLIDSGRVSRGYLGVLIQDDPKLLRSFGYSGAGVLINDVRAGDPGDTAGLKAGDIVTAVNGKAVVSATELRGLIAATAPNTTVRLSVYRDGDTLEVPVKLGELPQSAVAENEPERSVETEQTMTTLNKIGLEAASTVSEAVASRMNLRVDHGVVIDRVRPGSAAAAAGLERGVVITQVMGTPVNSVEELEEALSAVDLSEGVRIRANRDGANVYLYLSLTS